MAEGDRRLNMLEMLQDKEKLDKFMDTILETAEQCGTGPITKTKGWRTLTRALRAGNKEALQEIILVFLEQQNC